MRHFRYLSGCSRSWCEVVGIQGSVAVEDAAQGLESGDVLVGGGGQVGPDRCEVSRSLERSPAPCRSADQR